jgi:predicted 3-demethylubiquinone-9 3-methyltransferase (glyoxalase superfamily)
MKKLTTFLWFENGAKEASDFYKSIFKDNAHIASTSILHNTPSGTVEMITMDIFGQDFTLMTAGPFRKFNEAISFVIPCDSQEEVDYYWNSLSAVREAEQCGWIKDKFGVSWQIVPKQLGILMGDKDPVKAGRVQKAMLAMKKIIISDLQKAYDSDNS